MAARESWASSPAARSTMQANRGRDTGPELALRRAVHGRGLRYFVNRRPLPRLRRTADLVFPTLKLAVFLDGCFWHGCPLHHNYSKANAGFWAKKVQQNRERDAETNALLIEQGWKVLRIWEHVPVTEAADLVCEEVQSARSITAASSRD
ncbi:very short patch repair endonuclease [Terrabacter sp. MAHUQ-38]|uniref:very short patch repair endonuclease n=1 Tax=unclassified Terrabacter TaxID=2630222 RepID=UPI00165DFA30|nr:very short patch repair endonuclease [Terrabacter sp. MAHUQ-38]MBC9819730.1 very short patch repair endonuclease [Terrabacter sp. MAHUQ-38]